MEHTFLVQYIYFPASISVFEMLKPKQANAPVLFRYTYISEHVYSTFNNYERCSLVYNSHDFRLDVSVTQNVERHSYISVLGARSSVVG
jgi:hypothetical protein